MLSLFTRHLAVTVSLYGLALVGIPNWLGYAAYIKTPLDKLHVELGGLRFFVSDCTSPTGTFVSNMHFCLSIIVALKSTSTGLLF